MENSQIIFYGLVVDSLDVQGLGRVRVIPQNMDVDSELRRLVQSNPNIDPTQLLNPQQNDVADAYKFGFLDPFVFSPAMGLDLNVTPNDGETVRIMYFNKDENTGHKDQIYFGRVLTSPMNLQHENGNQSYGMTSQGFNLKTPYTLYNQNGVIKESKSSGIFAKPEDNCFYGRGSSDLILKGNEVLLRAGKSSNMVSNSAPTPNTNLGFLQISYFDSDKLILGPSQIVSVEEPNNPVKLVVEYDITSGLDTENPLLNGELKIYTLPTLKEMSQKLFNFSTDLPKNVDEAKPLLTYKLEDLSVESVAEIINTILRALINNQEVVLNGAPSWKPLENSFPFFFRPSKNLRTILQSVPDAATQVTDFLKYDNLVKLFKLIKPIDSFKDFGFGLVSQKGKLGKYFRKNRSFASPAQYTGKRTSISVLASNKIYLTNYNDKIKLKDEDIYGLSIDKITDIHSKSHPTVRGDKLLLFLKTLVKYVQSHTHSCSGDIPRLSPDISKDLEDRLNSFAKDVLNDDIRIS